MGENMDTIHGLIMILLITYFFIFLTLRPCAGGLLYHKKSSHSKESDNNIALNICNITPDYF